MWFLPILWCNTHVGHHLQEELAKFGYRSERKAKKKLRVLPYFCKPIIWIWQFQKKRLKSWWLSCIFFSQKSFVWVWTGFFPFFSSQVTKTHQEFFFKVIWVLACIYIWNVQTRHKEYYKNIPFAEGIILSAARRRRCKYYFCN